MSYSQLGQDTAVLDFYSDVPVGYYVDIGAFDGKTYSNTLLLEEKGWVGVCAEPLPSAFKKMSEIRKFCYKTDKAVWHTSGEKKEFATVGRGVENIAMLSGFTGHSTYTEEQDAAEKITVETISLNDLLAVAAAPNFMEYLSIDTEGTEYEILFGLDNNRYKFGLIDVEHNYDEEKRRAIRDLLEGRGYVLLRENKWDDCYVHHTQRKE